MCTVVYRPTRSPTNVNTSMYTLTMYTLNHMYVHTDIVYTIQEVIQICILLFSHEFTNIYMGIYSTIFVRAYIRVSYLGFCKVQYGKSDDTCGLVME